MSKSIKISYVTGARNSKKRYSLNLDVAGTLALNSEQFRAYVLGIAGVLQSRFTTDMEIVHIGVRDEWTPGAGVPRPSPLSIDAKNLRGTRAIPNGDSTLSMETVVIIAKEATIGRNGKMELRGMLLESDVDATADGTPAFKNNTPPATLSSLPAALKAAINSSGMQQVLSKDNAGGDRGVRDLALNGLSTSQTTIQRKTPSAKLKGYVKSRVALLNTNYVDATTNNAGGKIELTAQQKADFQAEANDILKYASRGQLGKWGVPKAIQPLFGMGTVAP